MNNKRFFDVELLQRFTWGSIEGKNHFMKISDDSAIRQDGQKCIFAEKCKIQEFDTPIKHHRKAYNEYMQKTYG